MPNQPKTPIQRFRLDDHLWTRFDEAIGRTNPDSDRSKVLRQFIAWYVREPGAKLPARPSAVTQDDTPTGSARPDHGSPG